MPKMQRNHPLFLKQTRGVWKHQWKDKPVCTAVNSFSIHTIQPDKWSLGPSQNGNGYIQVTYYRVQHVWSCRRGLPNSHFLGPAERHQTFSRVRSE